MDEKVEVIVANNEKLMDIVWNVRHKVFTVEQGIPAELDKDGEDSHATNILLNVQGRIVGTGRLVIKNGKGKLARIAVLDEFRGRGYASVIVRALEAHGEELGVDEFELYPHNYLEKLYQQLGYSRDPDYFSSVAGHKLIRMTKNKRSGN